MRRDWVTMGLNGHFQENVSTVSNIIVSRKNKCSLHRQLTMQASKLGMRRDWVTIGIEWPLFGGNVPSICKIIHSGINKSDKSDYLTTDALLEYHLLDPIDHPITIFFAVFRLSSYLWQDVLKSHIFFLKFTDLIPLATKSRLWQFSPHDLLPVT